MGKETGFNRKNTQAVKNKRKKKFVERAAIGNATAQRERMARHKASRSDVPATAVSAAMDTSSGGSGGGGGAAGGDAKHRSRSKSRSKDQAFKDRKTETAAAAPKKDNPKHIKLQRISKKKARRILTQIKINQNEKDKAELIRTTAEASKLQQQAQMDSIISQFASMSKK